MLKQVTRLVREADPTMIIVPFTTGDSNDSLDHEDNLPIDEDSLN